MKQFLAVYTGSNKSGKHVEWNALDEATRNKRVEEGMKAWHGWMIKHEKAIVVQGGPLGKTKLASKSGIADIQNNLTGHVVIEAESHEAAAKLFIDHPHFAIFPGDAVEIMECLPIPG